MNKGLSWVFKKRLNNLLNTFLQGYLEEFQGTHKENMWSEVSNPDDALKYFLSTSKPIQCPKITVGSLHCHFSRFKCDLNFHFMNIFLIICLYPPKHQSKQPNTEAYCQLSTLKVLYLSGVWHLNNFVCRLWLLIFVCLTKENSFIDRPVQPKIFETLSIVNGYSQEAET